MAIKHKELMSTGEIAVAIGRGAQGWQVGRLLESGEFGPVQKVGRTRVVPAELLPAIEEKMQAKGWLKDAD